MLNEKLIAIDKGRDAGKTFKVREMPVTRLEKWAEVGTGRTAL